MVRIKYIFLLVFLFPFFHQSAAQSQINRKLTFNLELYNSFGLDGLLFEEMFKYSLTPTVVTIEALYAEIYIRLRPNARVGFTIGPGKELFVQTGFYNTRVWYRSAPGSDLVVAHGTTFTAGTGIRFYRRKKSALAPLGKYFQLALNLHHGNNTTEEGDKLSSQGVAEFRVGLGKQYPLNELLLMDVGVGFGATAGLGMKLTDPEPLFLEENTFQSYLIGNSFFLRIGLGIIR